jgi:quercetin dioxygenase-like cupin family protein
LSDEATKPAPYGVKHITESPWYVSKGHTQGATSKRLVGTAHGAKHVGYVLSCYTPGNYMEPHVHKVREQVYHILEGEGVLVIDGVKHRVGPGDVAFFPAGVRHGLYNEGTQNLVFVIASGPAEAE